MHVLNDDIRQARGLCWGIPDWGLWKDERSRYENHAGITRREHRDRIILDSNTDIYQFCFWNTFWSNGTYSVFHCQFGLGGNKWEGSHQIFILGK